MRARVALPQSYGTQTNYIRLSNAVLRLSLYIDRR
jgi:hypothetical protein